MSMILFSLAVSAVAASPPTAVFAFCDSILDPSNNNGHDTINQADHYPYGIDFPARPTKKKKRESRRRRRRDDDVRVEKATSDLHINPDWALNMDICDYANFYPGQARDILQAVKKRLQHKNPKVQFLAVTLLETMVKNCGDYVHHQIAERNILGEKKPWRSGVIFPRQTPDAAPIFTPTPTHPTLRHDQAGYGMPSNSSLRLDEAMANDTESLNASTIDSMKSVVEVLSDMLQLRKEDRRNEYERHKL
ncbi:hypothetical protein MLD38_036447 [Melastoma candidum]|uniref:Uncharacterized protein n=1 Tax=Melastoma candidum TaxID=119954 RepID=A0ACB9LKX0_9MYRT|nr:hypothetical protein MLD38_036447 [Melastoma candidum]